MQQKLLSWFQANQGKELLVPGQKASLAGQCFQAVDECINEVFGLPFFYADIALDFWTQPGWLLNYFDKITDGSIQIGDIVVYGAGINPEGAGHVDIAASDGNTSDYQGYDSNWNSLELEQVTHNGHDNSFILGSLRLKSQVPPAPTPTPSVGTARVISKVNVRRGGPSTAYPVSSQLNAGDTFKFTHIVTGQMVDGENRWYQAEVNPNDYVWAKDCVTE